MAVSTAFGDDQHAFHYSVSNSACNFDRDTQTRFQWLVSVTGSAAARSPYTDRMRVVSRPPALLQVHAVDRDSVCPLGVSDNANPAVHDELAAA